jgi:hypothetical protein
MGECLRSCSYLGYMLTYVQIGTYRMLFETGEIEDDEEYTGIFEMRRHTTRMQHDLVSPRSLSLGRRVVPQDEEAGLLTFGFALSLATGRQPLD